MTNEERQRIKEAIKQERDRLLAMGSTTKYELWEVVEKKHAELVAAWTGNLARERGLDLCQASTRALERP